jgi:hypothetical protein
MLSFKNKVLVHKRCVKQLRIVCGTTSPQHSKLSDSNGRYTSASSSTNGQQNGATEQLDRHRSSGASAMNARDLVSKQKVSNIGEPGPLKRAQGKEKK